ncbi:MAG: PBP1A family penicillin-binding protein [Candidatus Woesebacteria bacterium]|nr:PBP1A family penicillin-binding protein [Candidatus Woesebacteria bacterium]
MRKRKVITATSLLAAVLTAIGKPFYFIFSHIFIAIAFVFYLIINIRFPKIKPSLFILTILFLSLVIYFFIFKDLPSPNELVTRDQEVSTKIYDRHDNLLYTIYKDKNRTPVKLAQIPENVKLATLAAEDAEFYNHIGFSTRGTIRAISKNITEGKLQGGSTITQQLVKNALLSSEKTYIRKIRELILSIRVEMNFTKDEILEMYLNEVSYGGTVYGIQEASKHYFDKNVEDLTLSEAALLAGLPQSPTRYSPFGNNPDLTFSRQREVLYLMKINRYITVDMEKEAIEQRITFAPNKTNIKAPHFVMYIREKLIEEYGEEVVLKGGLVVKTTLDLDIQNLAEKVAREEINKLKNLNVGNTGIVVLNPKNGEILAMVGSVDYFDTEKGGNVNVTTRPRQPGSSIKIVNYAEALTNGLTLASIVDDSPITFSVAGTTAYSPNNYDGTYKGKITVRQALAQSRNIPAVKILASYGVDKMIEMGEKMGITTWSDRSRFGLSLTLGGGETKLLELAEVYSVVANMGVKNEIKSITEIKNYKDKLLYQDKFDTSVDKVLDPRVAFLLIDVLKDNFARSPAFGTNSMLVIPNHPEVAVKTGTSNNLKDNLTIGFNSDYLVAVWVGNNDGSSMSRVASGITGAAPIWNKIMRTLIANQPSINWVTPDGLIYKDCYSRKEWFLEERQLVCP